MYFVLDFAARDVDHKLGELGGIAGTLFHLPAANRI
jgi:hypothetical protein